MLHAGTCTGTSSAPVAEVTKGDKVYIADSMLCYRECVVKESKDGEVICFDADYKIYKVCTSSFRGRVTMWPCGRVAV